MKNVLKSIILCCVLMVNLKSNAEEKELSNLKMTTEEFSEIKNAIENNEPTIKLSNYDTTYPKGYDGKGIPHIENLATVSDALNLFRKEGMPPKPGISSPKDLVKDYYGAQFEKLKLGKNTLWYGIYPAGMPMATTNTMAESFLTLEIKDSKFSRNTRDIEKILKYAQKLSQFMLQSPLPPKIVKAINDFKISSEKKDFDEVFENDECKITIRYFCDCLTFKIIYNTTTCH